MADCYSNYIRDIVNDTVHGGTSFSWPATTYFALMSVNATASGGGTEISGGGYARQAVTRNTTNWPASSGQQKQNGTVINYGTNTGSPWAVVGIAEYDAASSGNLITYAALTTPVTVGTGQPFQIPINGALYNWAA
jgi:hypothetical protein